MDEYETRQFFEQPIKWDEIYRSPNPKTYKLTGTAEASEILWYDFKVVGAKAKLQERNENDYYKPYELIGVIKK